MAEDIKKNEELDDEELDLVAGGVYTPEEWAAMTSQQRAAAQQRSRNARRNNQQCELD